MTADVASLRAWLDELEQTRAKATPGPWRMTQEVVQGSNGAPVVASYGGLADAACIVAEHNAATALIAAVRGALDLADELHAKALPVPAFHGDEIAQRLRAVLAAALPGGAQ